MSIPNKITGYRCEKFIELRHGWNTDDVYESIILRVLGIVNQG